MVTVPEGANVHSIAMKRSVEAKRRIKVRAKAEVKGKKGGSISRSNSQSSKGSGSSWSRSKSRKRSWSRRSSSSNTRSQICRDYVAGKCTRGKDCKWSHPPICKHHKMDTATKGKAANTCTLSAVKPPGSPQKNEGDPWKRLLKGKGLRRKANPGDLKRINANIRIRRTRKGSWHVCYPSPACRRRRLANR